MFENGIETIRADFHLHTRKDKEFKYNGEENDYIKLYVKGLVDAGIGIGVITNHNKFDENEYKAIKRAAKKENILILPGVELSVKEGANGIHTLIIFNPDEWIQNGDNHIQSFLASAFAGISNPENRNTRCNYDLRTMFERLDAYGKDYFIVFAHVDQGNGLFEECKGGMLESIAETASFQKRVLGLQKSRTYSNLGKFKEYFDYSPALVEGSDPKSIAQIGKSDKSSFLRIGEFSYSAVKFALQDYSNRVFEDKPSNNHGFIESISFQGGRFDGQTIHFSPSLNTLIGIRGSGKSAILESIRYILGINPQADKSYKTDLIKNIWGSGGKATLLIYDKHGRKYYISRILNERITVLDENGDDLNISPLSLLDGVQYFGQKDLSTSADQEKELLSKLVGTSIDNEDVIKHINKLIAMYEHMQQFSQIPSQLSELSTKIAETKHKLSIYKEKGIESKLKKQSAFVSDKAKITSVKSEIENALSSIKKVVDNYSQIATNLPEYKSEYNSDLFLKLVQIVSSINVLLENIKKSIVQINKQKDDAIDVLNQLEQKIESLAEEFAAVKREIQDTSIDTDAFSEMKLQLLDAEDRHTKLSETLKQKKDFVQLFLSSVRQRNEDLNSIFRQYQEEARKINEAQTELKIDIEFKGDKENFKARIKADFRGTSISDAKYSIISTTFSDYVDIISELVTNDGKRLQDILSSNEYVKFCEKMAEKYKELIQYQVPDKVEIFYHNKLLRKHSLGQRASALILFILTQNNNDIIIIDQPEDDLDNKVIYDEVISAISKTKPNVQFIFATHNANIPVLGDAERVLVVDFNESEIEVSQGNIDMLGTQKQIIDIMEGGREAFDKRKMIYTSWRA